MLLTQILAGGAEARSEPNANTASQIEGEIHERQADNSLETSGYGLQANSTLIHPQPEEAEIPRSDRAAIEGRGDASTIHATKRTKIIRGEGLACHFGCTDTNSADRSGKHNWKRIPLGSRWWGLPSGTVLCHRHYQRGWGYARRHCVDPPPSAMPDS